MVEVFGWHDKRWKWGNERARCYFSVAVIEVEL